MDATKTGLYKPNNKLTILSLFLGIIVWFMDLNSVYALPSVACKWNWFPFTIGGIPGLLIVEAAISLIDLILMAILIYLPWRNWRYYQTHKPTDNPQLLGDTEKNRTALLAFIAMMLNSFFFLFIIALFVPMVMLKACATG